MAHVPDIAVVDQARKRLGLSLRQLWLSYFALGGKADRLEFEAFFQGLMRPDAFEYNILVHALNEHLMDLGEVERIPYVER